MTEIAQLAHLLATARVVDLSPTLRPGIPRWITHPPLVVHPTITHEHDGYYCQTLFIAEHVGAHVDAPAHTQPAMMDRTIDAVAPDALLAPASVFDLSGLELGPGDVADAATLARIDVQNPEQLGAGEIALLNYGWMRRTWREDGGWRAYAEHGPGLSEDAVLWLAERGVCAVGADTLSCDQPLRDGVATQRSYGHQDHFLPLGILMIEVLANLEQLPPRCFFLAQPLKIERGSGSPIRPLALVWEV